MYLFAEPKHDTYLFSHVDDQGTMPLSLTYYYVNTPLSFLSFFDSEYYEMTTTVAMTMTTYDLPS